MPRRITSRIESAWRSKTVSTPAVVLVADEDLPAVGSPVAGLATGRDALLLTAESGDDIDSGICAPPSEGNETPIGRPHRTAVLTGVSCKAERSASADELHPDIEVVEGFSFPGEGHAVAFG